MTEKNVTNEAGANFPASAIKPVPLFEITANDKRRCQVCEFGCELAPGEYGVCKVRTNQDGTLVTRNYGVISRANLERVEHWHLYHFFPGTKIFSVGGFGHNFPAFGNKDQYSDIPTQNPRVLPIERIIKFSIEQHCRGVVFGYNEPSMWYEYLYDALRVVKANGMYTGIVTNGYFTPKAFENFGHYLDGMLLELNAFSENTFKILTGQTQVQKVLETAVTAQRNYKIHVEIETQVVPGVNDDWTELGAIATWIKETLGENTAWHLVCNQEEGPELLAHLKAQGQESGLRYIYTHTESENAGSEGAAKPPELLLSADPTANGQTFCRNCHRLMIQRNETETRTVGLERDRCTYCGSESGIHSTIWKL